MKFISNCAAVFLIFCATLQAQTPTNVDGTYTIPIYHAKEYESIHDLHIYAALNGGVLVPYLLDSGSPNFFSTYAQTWWPGSPDQVVTGNSTMKFASGNEFVYNPVNASVQLGDRNGKTIVSIPQAQVAILASATVGDEKTDYKDWKKITGTTSEELTKTPALVKNSTFGNFGLGIEGNKSNPGNGSNYPLSTILAQLPLPPSVNTGFIVNTGGKINAPATLTIGITPQCQRLFESAAIQLCMGTSNSTIAGPNGTTVPGYYQAQAQGTIVTVKTSKGEEGSWPLPTIFDTGGGDGSYIMAGKPPKVPTGNLEKIEVSSGGQTFLNYDHGKTPLGGGLSSKSSSNFNTETAEGPRTNTGLAAFYEFIVAFDLTKGEMYLLPFSAVDQLTLLDNALTPATANFKVSSRTCTENGSAVTIKSLTFSPGCHLVVGGALSVTSGTMAVQSGSSVVSGGNLITPGNLKKTGAGELDIQSNMIVHGTAIIDQGLLSVKGNLLANNVAVNSGATLGGNGTIYSSVNVQGNLSPGNSPGTLTIAGNLVLSSASATNIEIASLTSFDRIIVGGTATLSGTVNIIPYGGNTLAYGQQYNIIQAGSITGDFASITAPETFRGRFLNGGTVGTLLIAPDTYTRVAVTPNQRAVAKALDGFIPATSGDRLFVSTMLDLQTAEQYPIAFNQIMPGYYESLPNIAIEQAFAQTQMLNQRMSSVRFGAAGFQALGGISQPLVNDKNGKSAAEAKDASPIVNDGVATNWNTWALGNGEFSRTMDLSNLQNYNTDAGGFLVGADYRWNDSVVTGLYAGYEYTYGKYNGGSTLQGNGVNFGGYASYAKKGFYADAVVGGGYTGFQTKRTINFSTIDRTASADPSSPQFSAALNLGKDFEVGKFTFGPVGGVQYTYAGVGSFTETGADSLNLALGQQNANSLRTTLGGRVAYTWNLNKRITLIPEVRMSWQHEFLNNGQNVSASLDGGNGASFNYETTAAYRDSAFAGAGVTAQFGKNVSGSVFYNVNFGSQTYQSNMVSVGLNLGF